VKRRELGRNRFTGRSGSNMRGLSRQESCGEGNWLGGRLTVVLNQQAKGMSSSESCRHKFFPGRVCWRLWSSDATNSAEAAASNFVERSLR
jgi:hypothetical protein